MLTIEECEDNVRICRSTDNIPASRSPHPMALWTMGGESAASPTCPPP